MYLRIYKLKNIIPDEEPQKLLKNGEERLNLLGLLHFSCMILYAFALKPLPPTPIPDPAWSVHTLLKKTCEKPELEKVSAALHQNPVYQYA